MVSPQNTTSFQQAKTLANRALRAGQSLERSMRPYLEEVARCEKNKESHAILLAVEQAQRNLEEKLARENEELTKENDFLHGEIHELRQQQALKEYSDREWFSA